MRRTTKPPSVSSPAPRGRWASKSPIRSALLRHVAPVAKEFPALQRDRDIAVFPEEIVEGAEAEFLALLHARVSEKFHDLQLSDLVRDCLTRTYRKGNRFLARRLFVHRNFFLQVFRGLCERELAERKFHVHFHAQRAETHEIVNDLARVRAVIEQSSLQHHFLSIKADPFVRA